MSKLFEPDGQWKDKARDIDRKVHNMMTEIMDDCKDDIKCNQFVRDLQHLIKATINCDICTQLMQNGIEIRKNERSSNGET